MKKNVSNRFLEGIVPPRDTGTNTSSREKRRPSEYERLQNKSEKLQAKANMLKKELSDFKASEALLREAKDALAADQYCDAYTRSEKFIRFVENNPTNIPEIEKQWSNLQEPFNPQLKYIVNRIDKQIDSSQNTFSSNETNAFASQHKLASTETESSISQQVKHSENPVYTSLENSDKKIQFGVWEKTQQEIKEVLNNFTTTFDGIRKGEMTAENIDPDINLLAQSGGRTLQKFFTLVNQYSAQDGVTPQDRDIHELRSLVEQALFNRGKLPNQEKAKKYTFTENERALATTWMIPYATKGINANDRKKILIVFNNHTSEKREKDTIYYQKSKFK